MEEEDEGNGKRWWILPPQLYCKCSQLSLWNDRIPLSISLHDTGDHKPGEPLVPKLRDSVEVEYTSQLCPSLTRHCSRPGQGDPQSVL